MNKKIIIGTILSLILWSSSAWALDFGKVAMFGVGIVSGSYWHEFGHATMALVTGAHVDDIQ